MTRILLLENRLLSPHRLRKESRRSGLCLLYESVATPAAFAQCVARGHSLIVGTCDGIEGMALREIAETARRAKVRLFLIGGDTSEERQVLADLGSLVHDSCRSARLPWLPMLLDRAVREIEVTQDRQQRLDAAAEQTRLVSEQMREVQKLAVIGRLAGSIAHEINNPLESITNLVYLLGIDDQLPTRLQEYVKLAEQELKRVTQISKQTLSFYRETQVPVRVELSALLEEALVLYRRRLGEKQITVVRRYESEEALLLFPGEIRQVFSNLVANAIEATEEGGRLVLRIHKARQVASGYGQTSSRDHQVAARDAVEGVRVLVADSGAGMAPEVLRKLGQPFFTTKGQRGTGLGLWVSQAIIQRYNGTIQLRSSTSPQRHGTTFSIFLPLNLGPQMVEGASGVSRSQPLADRQASRQGVRLRAGSN